MEATLSEFEQSLVQVTKIGEAMEADQGVEMDEVGFTTAYQAGLQDMFLVDDGE